MRRIVVSTVLALAAAAANAVDINVVALTAGKAVVVINKGKPQTLAVGQSTPEGVKLISASSESATFEVEGRRETLAAGQGAAIAAGPPADRGTGSVTLIADKAGHFMTVGVVNGISLRFMVDTGATTIVLSASDAKRVGVNYLTGIRSFTQTANGIVPVYRVKLDSVRVGDITMHGVDAVVIDGDRLPFALLGLSFLNRTEMKRDGDTMTLIKRY